MGHQHAVDGHGPRHDLPDLAQQGPGSQHALARRPAGKAGRAEVEEDAGDHGLHGEQAESGGGGRLHAVLEEHRQFRLALGGLGVHADNTHRLQKGQIAAVQVAAAPVGGGIAQAHAYTLSGLIGGQLQALGVDGKVGAAVLLAQDLAARPQLSGGTAAIGHVLHYPQQIFRLVRLQTKVSHALLLELHGEGDSARQGDGVHTQQVTFVIQLIDEIQVVVFHIGSEEAQGLVLRALDLLAPHLHSPLAADRAADAAAVAGQPGVRQGLAADVLVVLVPAPSEVAGGQHTGGVGLAHQAR